MCCIFTCCGWLIDLFQRAWVFAMSFCMSGAICCVLTLGSLSGVALGYNYSLAEYMDLKETNVSVYLKRGVFDDEGLADDMNFRRSGEEEESPEQMPNQMRRSGNEADDSGASRRSGNRLDDSLLQSNLNHGFEGGLLKLTMAPPFAITTTTPTPGRDAKVENAFMKHAPGSLDQLKELQSILSYRKALAEREPGQPGDHMQMAGYPGHLISEDTYLPPHLRNAQQSPGRRFWQAPSTNPDPYNTMPNFLPGKIHPAMMAVPPPGINAQQYWEAFKTTYNIFAEYSPKANSPEAIRLNTLGDEIFPTQASTRPVFTEERVPLTLPQTPSEFMKIGLDSGGGQMEQKLILDKYVPYMSSVKPFAGEGEKGDSPKSDNEYYDDEIKGLPVRRKRHIRGIKRKRKSQNALRYEQEKSDSEHADKVVTVNHNNVITNTDPSFLATKPESECEVHTKASDLNSKLEKTPLYDQLISTKVYQRIRGIKRKTKGQNAPRYEQEKSDSEHADKVVTVNHNNVITNTDTSVLVSKPVSEYEVHTQACDLKSKLEKTPLYDQLINNKVKTESRILIRGLLGKTSRSLNIISHELKDARSAEPNFIKQRRFVFSFSPV